MRFPGRDVGKMDSYKSLFIISVPRSASTALEDACSIGLSHLKFRNKGETLNPGHNSKLKKLKIPQYTKKIEHFEILKDYCENHKNHFIIRDVVQTNFIVQNIDWLKSKFNFLLLVRPISEIMISRNKLGWKMSPQSVKKYQQMLIDLPNGIYQRIDYYDFIQNDTNKLVQILQKWYPECHDFEYIGRDFLRKRRKTLAILKNHGIRQKK